MINEQIIKKTINSAILEFCLKYQVDDIVNRELIINFYIIAINS